MKPLLPSVAKVRPSPEDDPARGIFVSRVLAFMPAPRGGCGAGVVISSGRYQSRSFKPSRRPRHPPHYLRPSRSNLAMNAADVSPPAAGRADRNRGGESACAGRPARWRECRALLARAAHAGFWRLAKMGPPMIDPDGRHLGAIWAGCRCPGYNDPLFGICLTRRRHARAHRNTPRPRKLPEAAATPRLADRPSRPRSDLLGPAPNHS